MPRKRKRPTPLEIDTARAAFEAILKWCEAPGNPVIQRPTSVEYYQRNAQFGLQMLSASTDKLPLKKTRVISSKNLGQPDPYDDYSGKSCNFELSCEPDILKFASSIDSSSVAYSWCEDFVCSITGEKQFPVTEQKLQSWLSGFLSQLSDFQNSLWFYPEEIDKSGPAE
ncbi:MAG: hypothetical protein JWM11_3728 [Planctomycetaceae bacterium]|nr:hypothetical protein [Planctomycetaceae bacterium]